MLHIKKKERKKPLCSTTGKLLTVLGRRVSAPGWLRTPAFSVPKMYHVTCRRQYRPKILSIHICLPLGITGPTGTMSCSFLLSDYQFLGPQYLTKRGFLTGSDGKESVCKAGDPGLRPGSGRSLGEENGYPLQYSCLENRTDRGAWRATVQGSTDRLSTHTSDKEPRTQYALKKCLRNEWSTADAITFIGSIYWITSGASCSKVFYDIFNYNVI